MRILRAPIAAIAAVMMMGGAGVMGVPATSVIMQRRSSVVFQLMA